MKTILAVLTAAMFASAAILYCPILWSALLLTVASLIGFVAWGSKKHAVTFSLANVAAILGALALFEVYFGYEQERGDGTTLQGARSVRASPVRTMC
jgi:hypothetical protein